jgi:hypothetical protein
MLTESIRHSPLISKIIVTCHVPDTKEFSHSTYFKEILNIYQDYLKKTLIA